MKKLEAKTTKILVFGVIAVILIGCLSLGLKSCKEEETAEVPEVNHYYNENEGKLAAKVKNYLAQYLELSENEEGNIADAAVQNYNIVMGSGTDVITTDITEAMNTRIRTALIAFINDAGQFTEDDLDALASGITEIIWKTVLNQISESDLSASTEYQEEFLLLAQSLQEQIDSLEERKMKVSINAKFIDNADSLNLSDEELRKLAERMGLSVEDIESLIEESDLSDDLREQIEKEIYDLRRELLREIDASAGKTGATGAKGEKGDKGERGATGKTGEDGKDGEDGSDGKTTFIAYADDKNGTNFSLTPTETSKYVGTCVTADTVQPTSFASYGNWQEYRTYIITSTVDPNTGVTTVHIN